MARLGFGAARRAAGLAGSAATTGSRPRQSRHHRHIGGGSARPRRPAAGDCSDAPPVRHRRSRGGGAIRKHAQPALAIALEPQDAVFLAGAHQVGDRSVAPLLEIRLCGLEELLELARIHRPARRRGGFAEHAANSATPSPSEAAGASRRGASSSGASGRSGRVPSRTTRARPCGPLRRARRVRIEVRLP